MSTDLHTTRTADAGAIAHSVMSYDRLTDELVREVPIPLLLDRLALHVAGVPAEDRNGAVSYPLQVRQAQAFGFLLGLEIDPRSHELFLEASDGPAAFSTAQLAAIAELSAAATADRSDHGRSGRLGDADLLVPILRLLEAQNGAWIGVIDLVHRVARLVAPAAADSEILRLARETVARRDTATGVVRQRLAEYDAAAAALRISERGLSLVRALRA